MKKRTIDAWVEHGLISVEQAQSIFRYEQEHSHKHNWAGYSIAGVGVAAVALGTIGIVAANWDFIPTTMKLVSYVILQSILGLITLALYQKKNWQAESSLSLHALGFFAGIGLVAQVYHLAGPLWKPLAFWLALSLPMALISRRHGFPYLWSFLAFVLVAIRFENIALRPVMELMFFAVLALGLAAHRYRGFADSLLYSLKWVFGSVFVVLMLYGKTFLDDPFQYPHGLAGMNLGVSIIAWLLPVAAIFYSNRKDLGKGTYLACSFFVLGFLYFYSWPYFRISMHPFLATLCFLVLCSILAVIALQQDYRRMFDVISFVMTIRIISFYVQMNTSLTSSGIGLVALGSFILAIVYLWHKFRWSLAEKIKEAV